MSTIFESTGSISRVVLKKVRGEAERPGVESFGITVAWEARGNVPAP
jgi:hypothetical protein